MKLIRAQFENFRLLRDLKLDFSTDKRLTVIRAENESGKTTILNGLQWALYGNDALPEKGKDYRLHPIDWDAADGQRIPISVQVEFETKRLSRSGPDDTIRYRIIRAGYEKLDGVMDNPEVRLFELTDTGSKDVDKPNVRIKEELPPELREVFFTDGDRALSFIEATASEKIKRDRVEKAIRSLLGLNYIDKARSHIKTTISDFNKAAKSLDIHKELTSVAAELEEIETAYRKLEKNIVDYKSQIAAIHKQIEGTREQIEIALVKGDREKLKIDIAETKVQLKQLDKNLAAAGQKHSHLFRGMFFSRDLLAPTLKKSLEKLSKLHTQGKIPSATIPVLEERLQGITCICGESLDSQTVDGKKRRDHIQCLIDESQQADVLQSKLTDLYYGSRDLQLDETANNKDWIAEYEKIVECRDKLKRKRDEQGEKLKDLEAQLDLIPDINIQGLRSTEQDYTDQKTHLSRRLGGAETQLEGLKKERKSLVLRRDNLLSKQRKGKHILASLDVARDVQSVLKKSYDRITDEELMKVSCKMNEIFLEMIGADPKQGAIIQRAEISKDYDILVYGLNNQMLNPDQDLNGASRRALTFAFILALTKVSEVEAPNVLDTPLGMMSGYVKRSVLRTAIRESSQLILFLTRSEIADCEEILDEEAGRVITLTNSAHYPRILVNDPRVEQRKTLRCECNHRKKCRLCQRRMDVETEV